MTIKTIIKHLKELYVDLTPLLILENLPEKSDTINLVIEKLQPLQERNRQIYELINKLEKGQKCLKKK